MLIVNNSMPKSGSSLLRHFVVEMIRGVCFKGQRAFTDRIKSGEITGRGTYVSKLDHHLIVNLLEISQNIGPVLVKVHLPYSDQLEKLLTSRDIFVTYNYRDPRDMILSAVDHHHRAKAMGQNDFGEYDSIPKALPIAVHWAKQAVLWKRSSITYDISYKYFLRNKLEVLNHINKAAGFALPKDTLQGIINQEVLDRKPGKNQFNKGLVSRYKNEMSEQDLEMCNSALKDYIDILA